MQEAFLKVFKNIGNFKGEVSIGAWIKKIVINQCIDYLKKRKIELVAITKKDLVTLEDTGWSVIEKSPVNNILQSINNLPEKYKVVLSLYLLEGYDHQEIAQILNIAEATSRSQLMRGKQQLKNELKQLKNA